MKKIIKREDGTLRVMEEFDLVNEPSKTRQEFKKDCDINEIIRKYKKTGQVTHMASHAGKYLDLGNAVDYHEAMNKVVRAKQAFDVLPSELRSRFRNDPEQLLAFVNDEKNYDEAAQLGLVPERKKVIEEPPKKEESK